ncbi:MFS general substrate transporter [Fistulina hepatica ATCC 64428]|uniref:MFS general substrate transporter n=1 Tax=Fistulina hepatica ATCC 64428 TaxID=1128425 RepID=A0A0D7ABZ8_9AGAR|nr:MFS general substrate transporter [Fistulina hepatica ATCC 64428]
MVPSEETPLLVPPNDVNSIFKHEAVYARFSPARKRVFVALVSWCGLLPLFVSGTFLPSIPQIAKDLRTSPQTISLAVSISILAAAIGSLTTAAYSTFYGRRPVFLVCMPLVVVASFGVGAAITVPELMIWRFLQAFGTSPGWVVGVGVIGDIYKLEERGFAMGIFFGVSLLGPAVAPVTGGFMAHYASWRYLQYAMGVAAAMACVVIFGALSETSHPGARGIDKIPEERRKRPLSVFFSVNPFAPLSLLRSPNLVAVSMSALAALVNDFGLLVPLAFTIGARYNLANEFLLGLCYIPAGVGNVVGAPLAERLSDRIIVKYRALREGVWYPEDRLRAGLFSSAILVPVPTLMFGLVATYVPGSVGLTLTLLCLFINGVGVDMTLAVGSAYCVDILHNRSAETMAVNTSFRALWLSAAVTSFLPLVESIGVANANAIAAVIGWIGSGLIWLTIRNGERMRAWVDVGYSTADTN